MVAVIAVFGPTASGKTAVAEEVADRLGTEVVSCDAMQVYRGLPILTNQPSRPTALVGIRDARARRCPSAPTRRSRMQRSTSSSPAPGSRSSAAAPASTSGPRLPTWTCRRHRARACGSACWPRWRATRPRRTRGLPASIRAQPRPCTRTTSVASSARSSSRKRASRSYRTTIASGRARPGTRP